MVYKHSLLTSFRPLSLVFILAASIIEYEYMGRFIFAFLFISSIFSVFDVDRNLLSYLQPHL